MSVRLPDNSAVERFLASVEAGSKGPSDTVLAAALHSPSLTTGLDHWQFWTLICLCRHLRRQQWVGYIVETRLKGDLTEIGNSGALGHPENVPQVGPVPDEPGWRYYFHGRGCCLSNKETGARIDVDFTREGSTDRIDPFFYSNFLEEMKQPEFPERLLQRRQPFEDAWQTNIETLVEAGCLDRNDGVHVTDLGKSLFEAVEPLLEKASALADTPTPSARRQLLRIGLELGDPILAGALADLDLPSEVARQMSGSAEKQKAARCGQLVELLGDESRPRNSCYLAALADLGVGYGESTVEKCLIRSPVDGLANAALAILSAWNHAKLREHLELLIDKRHAEAFGILSRLFKSADSNKDRLPRETQIVRAITKLLQLSRPEDLRLVLRSKILALLESTGGAHAGDAALLLYVFDKERGSRRLRLALSGKVPAARGDAAAACVLLGTREAQQIMLDAMENQNLEIQHTIACALEHFPSAEARERAAQWRARQDGIDSPMGKDVSIQGRTITAYNFDDIAHANMGEFFRSSLERLREDFGQILSRLSSPDSRAK